MLFSPLEVVGAFLVELEPHHDVRGFFARSFCADEFAKLGLPRDFPQSNLSRNPLAGTLRGMHYTVLPSVESKFVRCVSGAIYDVLVDVRAGSASFGKWTAVELSRENGKALFVPAGVAHGFLTTAVDSDVLYQMGDGFRADTARGLRWNDPAFRVDWPAAPVLISERDASYPNFERALP
jgi:dTDP-4-dehydrorhamnose 3,5-epimerase